MIEVDRHVHHLGYKYQGSRCVFLIVLFYFVLMLFSLPAHGDNVSLSGDQKDKLKQIAQDYVKKSVQLKMKTYTARAEMYAEYSSYNMDTKKADKAVKDLNEAQKAILMLHLQNQVDIRKVMDEQQFLAMTRMFPNPEHKSQPEYGMRELLNKSMIDMLNLTQKQQKSLGELWKLDDMANGYAVNIAGSTDSLMSLYRVYKLNTKIAKYYINEIHKNQRNLAKVNRNKMVLLQKILTKEQFNKLSPWIPNEKTWKQYWEKYKKFAPL